MNAVGVTQVGSDVYISWTPLNNNGRDIIEYKIQIVSYDGLYIEDYDNCDGSNPTVITNNYCIIPMSVFLDLPYNLTRGTLIQAVVSSKNVIGWSQSSPLNTIGAVVQTIPAQPSDLTIDQT